MNKGLLIGLIVTGSILTLATAGFITFCVINNNVNNKTVTREYEVSDFSNLNINLSTADLELKVAENGKAKVVCVEKEKYYHNVEVKDNSLNISKVDARKWYEYPFNFSWSNMKVTVYVPSKDFNDALIKISTGDVIIPDYYSFNNLSVESSTGDISIKSEVKEELDLKASTGSISLEADAKKAHLYTSTGRQTLKDVDAEEISCHVSTGHVALTNCIAEKTISVKSSTGDVKFSDSDAHELIDIETSTGDVNLSLLSGKTFETKTSTGKVDVPSSLVGGSLCKIKTSTGDIKVVVKE